MQRRQPNSTLCYTVKPAEARHRKEKHTVSLTCSGHRGYMATSYKRVKGRSHTVEKLVSMHMCMSTVMAGWLHGVCVGAC